MARAVGAEMATSIATPAMAVFSTISYEQRLVTRMKALAGSSPSVRAAPISLSRAQCRPTSSRTSRILPDASAHAAACMARVAWPSAWPPSRASKARWIAPRLTLRPSPAARRVRTASDSLVTPHRPQLDRPSSERLRARVRDCSAAGLSTMFTATPSSRSSTVTSSMSASSAIDSVTVKPTARSSMSWAVAISTACARSLYENPMGVSSGATRTMALVPATPMRHCSAFSSRVVANRLICSPSLSRPEDRRARPQ